MIIIETPINDSVMHHSDLEMMVFDDMMEHAFGQTLEDIEEYWKERLPE